jgi:1,4-dihydroxy-2-naphthoyl-CoA hydrolase
MNDVVHIHAFRVALHDTDAAGVLFFAHLFRHAHDAYEGFMTAIGWPLDAMIRDRELALPLVHAEADYRRPISHGQQVQIAVTVADIADGRFSIDYRFTDTSGAVLASARTVHAAVDPHRSRPIPLPPGLAAALRREAKQEDDHRPNGQR